MAEIETLDAPGHSLKRTLKDLFAGAAGGVAQVLTGMCSVFALFEDESFVIEVKGYFM